MGGETLTTSPITSNAVGGCVVQTSSGSSYYLESTDQTKQKAIELAAERKAEAEEERLLKIEIAEEKRAAEAERKQEIAEQRAAEAEDRRQLKLQAAEERKAAAEEKKRGAAGKKSATVVKSQQIVRESKPGATISLGSLFGIGKVESTVESDQVSGVVARKTSPRKVNKAPRGVPTISSWKQMRDGAIEGVISGSPNFNDGETLTTSPITSDAVGGCVVQTSSGSRYYLKENGESKKNPIFGKKKPVKSSKKI